MRVIKSDFQISDWPRFGKYVVCRASLMNQNARSPGEISPGFVPRRDMKMSKNVETSCTLEPFSYFSSSLIHVLHTLILEVVHMVFFLYSENSQRDDVQHSWDCGICAAALNTSNRRASTDSGAEQGWKWLFQSDCEHDSTSVRTRPFILCAK